MIYCVVPEEMEGELYDRLVAYYSDDSQVTVIVDRRRRERRAERADTDPEQRTRRDRRRARVPGEFPQDPAPE
ncbi:MAG TPA: hypothetical protein VHE14_01995 [Solirubrobacteraceae bacterium]|nr:hypothetical protein [Solirubrobacteraceae bacterium]